MFGSRWLAIVAVSLLAVIGGGLLAWWQWTRYQSATGTLQNLGYVLQWPLFGVFPGFMFWRIQRGAQRERALDAESAGTGETADGVRVSANLPVVPGQAAPLDLPTYVQNRTSTYEDDEDQELLAYNRRLARLADRERRHAG